MAAQAPNPWDRPRPIPTKGGPSATAVHTAVGAALTHWEVVENTLMTLFCQLASLDFDMGMRLYHCQPSSASKHKMVLAAGEVRFAKEPEALKYLQEAIKYTDKFLERRNDIAHGVAIGNESNGCLLVAPFHAGKSFDWKSRTWNYAFSADDIASYSKYFNHLHFELISVIQFLFSDEGYDPILPTPLSQYLLPARTALQNKRRRKSPPLRPQPSPPSPQLRPQSRRPVAR